MVRPQILLLQRRRIPTGRDCRRKRGSRVQRALGLPLGALLPQAHPPGPSGARHGGRGPRGGRPEADVGAGASGGRQRGEGGRSDRRGEGDAARGAAQHDGVRCLSGSDGRSTHEESHDGDSITPTKGFIWAVFCSL